MCPLICLHSKSWTSLRFGRWEWFKKCKTSWNTVKYQIVSSVNQVTLEKGLIVAMMWTISQSCTRRTRNCFNSSCWIIECYCMGPRNCMLFPLWQCRVSLELTGARDASLFDALTHKFTFSISAERQHTEWETDLVAHSEQLSKVNLVLGGWKAHLIHPGGERKHPHAQGPLT